MLSARERVKKVRERVIARVRQRLVYGAAQIMKIIESVGLRVWDLNDSRCGPKFIWEYNSVKDDRSDFTQSRPLQREIGPNPPECRC